jgi:hypothetical protein
MAVLNGSAILTAGVGGNAAKDGMFRAIPPIEVAKVVWQAYQSDKLHWYVPSEIFDLDKVATLAPEQTRDNMANGTLFAQLTAAAIP